MILLEYSRKNQGALKSTNLKSLLNICIIIEYMQILHMLNLLFHIILCEINF